MVYIRVHCISNRQKKIKNSYRLLYSIVFLGVNTLQTDILSANVPQVSKGNTKLISCFSRYSICTDVVLVRIYYVYFLCLVILSLKTDHNLDPSGDDFDCFKLFSISNSFHFRSALRLVIIEVTVCRYKMSIRDT